MIRSFSLACRAASTVSNVFASSISASAFTAATAAAVAPITLSSSSRFSTQSRPLPRLLSRSQSLTLSPLSSSVTATATTTTTPARRTYSTLFSCSLSRSTPLLRTAAAASSASSSSASLSSAVADVAVVSVQSRRMCLCHALAASAPLLAAHAAACAHGAQSEGCSPRDAEVAAALTLPDPSSWANHDVAPVTHMHFTLQADFASQTLAGSALATVAAKEPVAALSLDVNGLTVSRVTLLTTNANAEAGDVAEAETETEADFWMTRTKGKLGQALVVKFPAPVAAAKVKVYYSTAPSASAIQWLAPEQTEGKKHPYLFTQCQAIHARSLFPCQDSPGVKFTYTADITVPAPLQALMSAVLQSTTPVASADGALQTWSFNQAVPIPSYLVALCVGNLAKADISDRCAVWAEPEKVEAAAFEFGETEKFLAAAEELCGPYVWGRYDLLLMPPSYPYGGMENACLTFVTPTLLAGDRSLANVVAHEIAHSWSGNLVTNKTWESFFLNEGFTVFIERKILEKLNGGAFKGLHSIIGWEDLKGSVAQYGADHPFTRLQVTLAGEEDPDDAFSSVPYEKGCTLLTHFETLVGGPKVMNAFLKAYFAHFKYQCISTDDFRGFFLSFASANGVPAAKLDAIDWDTLLYAPGLPVRPEFDDSLARDVAAAAEAVIAGAAVPASCNSAQWTSTQVIVYLDKLIDAHDGEVTTANAAADPAAARAAVAAKWLAVMERAFEGVVPSVAAMKANPEQNFRYLTLMVRAGPRAGEAAAATAAAAEAFLVSNGRMKFVRPLYRDLFTSAFKPQGEAVFKRVKAQYHSICAKMVQRDLDAATNLWD